MDFDALSHFAALLVPCTGFVVLLALAIAEGARRRSDYRKSSYAAGTGKSYEQAHGDKGTRGEYLLSREVERALPGARMSFNAYVPKEQGGYSEIDVVAVTERSVYVLESKEYSSCWIFGREQDKTWTQTFKGGAKAHFYNPVRQNLGHARSLERALQLDGQLIVPIVVFSDKAVFKSVQASGSVPVIHRSELAGKLGQLEASRPARLTEAEVTCLHERIEAFAHPSDELREEHISDVRAMRGV